MKKKSIAAVLAVIVVLGISFGAVSADPGTSDDPLVSKSYVDAQVASVKAASGSYAVVHVAAGQTVIGEEGTEIIVRSGSVAGIDNGTNGISDITDGREIMGGEKVAENHLVLIPRSDGRGVKADSEAYLMIRGGYSLK